MSTGEKGRAKDEGGDRSEGDGGREWNSKRSARRGQSPGHGRTTRERIDRLLVERGLFPSRNRARAALMAGEILVDGRVVDKAGKRVPTDAEVRVKDGSLPYVSRGGLKLRRALRAFNISVDGLVVIDIGASTGGFTDCLLQSGARKVYAVDVGYGQLDWSLRRDPRVEVRERVNARYLTAGDFPVFFDLATIDVSFISLKKIIPAVLGLLKLEAGVVALIKPQFEAGPERVERGGVIRSRTTHRDVLTGVADFLMDRDCHIRGLIPSPIRGASGGNAEFLIYFTASGESRERNGGRDHPGVAAGGGIGRLIEDALDRVHSPRQ